MNELITNNEQFQAIEHGRMIERSHQRDQEVSNNSINLVRQIGRNEVQILNSVRSIIEKVRDKPVEKIPIEEIKQPAKTKWFIFTGILFGILVSFLFSTIIFLLKKNFNLSMIVGSVGLVLSVLIFVCIGVGNNLKRNL